MFLLEKSLHCTLSELGATGHRCALLSLSLFLYDSMLSVIGLHCQWSLCVCVSVCVSLCVRVVSGGGGGCGHCVVHNN